jgi:alpha-L-rhamnosidase
MHFVFDAMATAGIYNAEAERQMTRWQIVPDTQSFHEMWSSGDLSHAWNATPLYQMSGVILGVRPTKPGFVEFAIQPHPCDLAWAKGRVPTPHGTIDVAWKRVGNSLKVDFTVPNGTLADVGGRTYDVGRHSVSL